MAGILSLLSVLFLSLLLVRFSAPATRAEAFLLLFLFSTAVIIASGYLLSSLNHLADGWYWCGIHCCLLIGALVVIISRKNFRNRVFHSVTFPKTPSIHAWIISLSHFERLAIVPLLGTATILGMVNFIVVIFTAPGTWDGIAYHLPRMAYYLQHNNLGFFEANYWAQVVHPKNSALLLIYTYLVSAKNDNLTQLVGCISYWISVTAVYGIALKIGMSKTQSLFSTLVFALFIECLMQATSLLNDMIIAAYSGIILYFLCCFRESPRAKYLLYAALGFALALGTKASFLLVIPVILLLFAYILLTDRTSSGSRKISYTVLFMVLIAVACCCFALPSGYLQNYNMFGNPVGPANVLSFHSNVGAPLSFIVSDGSKNLVRIGLDFFTLDGLPPAMVGELQHNVKRLAAAVLNVFKIDLVSTDGIGTRFTFERIPASHEGETYGGILGFGLVIPVIVAAAFGSTQLRIEKFLAVTGLLYVVILSYALPYQPWLGRYCLPCAIMTVPLIGRVLSYNSRLVQLYIIVIALAGCISAVSAVSLKILINPDRKYSHKSLFAMNRLQQLTRDHAPYYEPMKKFDDLVPGDAIVAVAFQPNQFEYPLFGEKLTRKLIPIHSFVRGVQPVPAEADYLVYTYGYSYAESSDVYLGDAMFLRKLR